jgi:hypothetical protein
MKLKDKWSLDYTEKYLDENELPFVKLNSTLDWIAGFEFAKSELKRKLHYDENAYSIIDKLGEDEVETK